MRKTLALVLAVCGVAFAADSPAPKPLPESSKLRLVVAFQSALLAQDQTQIAQRNLNEAVARFNAAQEAEAKSNDLPAGTTFRVNPDTKDVTVVPPPAPPAPVEAPKAPK